MRGRLHPEQEGRSRSPSAASSATSPTGRRPTSAQPRATRRPDRQDGRHRRLRAGRADRRRRAGQARLRRHVFEAFHAPGGVLIYGIPEFRLPKDIVQAEVDRLVDEGVTIEVNAIIGRTLHARRAPRDFDALFIAVGAGLPVFMDVPGENFKGVYSANEYLTRVNLMGAWKRVGDPGPPRPAGSGRRRRQRRDGQRPDRPPAGAAEATIVYRRGAEELPGPGGRGPPRPRRGCRLRVPGGARRGARERRPLGPIGPVHADGARRARRIGSASARADPRLGVRDPVRRRRGRHRDPLESAPDGDDA